MNEDKIIEQQDSIVSLGKKLAELRKQQGLSEQDIASKIYVRKTLIENIESDKTENIPPVFLKGYIRSYANVVGLPESEYQTYLDSRASRQPTLIMKNYSNKEQNRRNGKRLLLVSLLIISIVIGITLFFIWKEDKNNLVEVNHYISPPPVSMVNG